MTDDPLCPVCGFDSPGSLTSPDGSPSFEICPSCGFEFGYDDGVCGETYDSYRKHWIATGCKFWAAPRMAVPGDWNPEAQLLAIGVDLDDARIDP